MYKLLVVDDEPYIIEGIKRMLDWQRYGFGRIEGALDYSEAVNKAVELRPDVALVDICIGESKGYELIEKLDVLGLPTCYIMMSGYDEFEYARRCISAGAKDYLLKPLSRETLAQAVERVLQRDLHAELPAQQDEESRDPVLGLPYDSFSNLTNKVLLIVQGEYMRNLSLKLVAEKFKMNATYLGQIFLKETKIKFSEYLMAYRMRQARRLIETGDEKVSVIARQVGYGNLNYFYTHFKAYYGVSPSDLRG